VGAKDRARRLEQAIRSELSSFELQDGRTYYASESYAEVYLHCFRCLEAGNPDSWPAPPELLLKVCEARDPAAALEEVGSKAIDDIFPFDPEIIVTERRLEPRSIVAGRDPYDQASLGCEDLSE
jgi:hypothetical protein